MRSQRGEAPDLPPVDEEMERELMGREEVEPPVAIEVPAPDEPTSDERRVQTDGCHSSWEERKQRSVCNSQSGRICTICRTSQSDACALLTCATPRTSLVYSEGSNGAAREQYNPLNAWLALCVLICWAQQTLQWAVICRSHRGW